MDRISDDGLGCERKVVSLLFATIFSRRLTR